MENLDFILSLFNQFIFQDAKNNIESLEYYVNVNPATSGNTLIQGLLKAIKDYSLDSIDIPLFQSILQRDRKNQVEQQQIIQDLLRWKSYTKAQMAPTKKYLEDIIAGSIISRANSKFQNDPAGYLDYLKKAEVKLDKSDSLVSYCFDKLDINSMVAEGLGKGFKSHFDWINGLFEPNNQYESGQIGIICFPPGTGKTLFMMTEAAHIALNDKDAKVLYVSMGDMKLRDFVIRMGAIVSGYSFAETARNIGCIYGNLKHQMEDRLDISVNPAGSVDPEELVEYVLAKGYNVVFIDYDSNFKMSSSDNMYNDFGTVYNAMTKLTLGNDVLVFIACQPNKGSWIADEINMGDLGESSRKGHIADFIFTGSKFNGPNHCGIFKCAKNRRGEEGDTIGYIRLGNGRFKFIPVDLAKQLAGSPKAAYSDSDIDAMVTQYNQNLNTIQAPSVIGTRPKIKNPFQQP